MRAGDDVKAYLRTQVVSPPLPVRLSGELSADLGVVVVRDVVDHERALLAHRIDGQSTRCTALAVAMYEQGDNCSKMGGTDLGEGERAPNRVRVEGLLTLFGLSRLLTLLELRLLLGLDVDNREDQPNAAVHVNTEPKREG